MMRTLFLSCTWKLSGCSLAAEEGKFLGPERRMIISDEFWNQAVFITSDKYEQANLYGLFSTVKKQNKYQQKSAPLLPSESKFVVYNLKNKNKRKQDISYTMYYEDFTQLELWDSISKKKSTICATLGVWKCLVECGLAAHMLPLGLIARRRRRRRMERRRRIDLNGPTLTKNAVISIHLLSNFRILHVKI